MKYEGRIALFDHVHSDKVVELFTQSFSESANKEEGNIVGALVSDLIQTTDPEDLAGFIMIEGEHICGGIFFSRLRVSSGQDAFLLSPLAVASEHQGRGFGQSLIRYGLDHLQSKNIEWVFTYGDPNYYSKSGFAPISETVVQAPYPLSQPVGWLAQSLGGKPLAVQSIKSRCVAAFDNPAYW